MKKNHFTFMRRLFLILFAVLLAGSFMSCSTKANDMRLNKLEKSIGKIEQNYRNYPPEKLKKEIDCCEIQLDELSEKKNELSQDQRGRLSNLKGRYHKLLFTIAASDVSVEIIEYIKGLLRNKHHIDWHILFEQ